MSANCLRLPILPPLLELNLNWENIDQNPLVAQITQNPPDLTNATSKESKEIWELKQQIKSLTEQVRRLRNSPSPPQTAKYCSHCQTHSHTLKECWRKPARGSCFDCRQHGCWRGNKDCPGKPNQNIWLTQGFTSPTINLLVNKKILKAVIDTGSGYTLITEAALKKLEGTISQRRAVPILQGVTGSPLRILG